MRIITQNKGQAAIAMSSYTQLPQEQQYQIYILMKAKDTQTEIADFINTHKSMICLDLNRKRLSN